MPYRFSKTGGSSPPSSPPPLPNQLLGGITVAGVESSWPSPMAYMMIVQVVGGGIITLVAAVGDSKVYLVGAVAPASIAGGGLAWVSDPANSMYPSDTPYWLLSVTTQNGMQQWVSPDPTGRKPPSTISQWEQVQGDDKIVSLVKLH